MPIIILGFALGISLMILSGYLQVIIVYLLMISIASSIFFLFTSQWLQRSSLFASTVLLGLLWVHLHLLHYNNWTLQSQLVSKNVLLTGKIESISQQNAYQSDFIFRTTKFNHQQRSILLRLSWYRQAFAKTRMDQQLRYKNLPHLSLDDTWQLVVRLKPPHGLGNPGQFDYSQWLWLHGIQATGYVVVSPHNFRISHQTFFLSRWREQTQDAIQNSVTDPDIAALLSALTVGLRDQFTPFMWTVLQQTGTNHLVVIAGLHLGLLIGIIYTFFLLSMLL